MITRSLSAIALALPLLLAACDEVPVSTGPSSGNVERLKGLGYQVAAQSESGATTVLRYSGPINASVKCGQSSGQFGTVQPRTVSANGTVQDFKLNSYLVLANGAARDGLYVISKATRSSSRASASSVETIAFEPGKSGRFASGLTCRAG
ncbi:pyruvate/2-oxoglutarate dehydrogenase complex [Tateyamaria sp. Alg231-49]|uniref:pyruvate/2-oxoglutarate dehydrogenase complex n=1 Tax=Tateyamaria sp. Alg231-49 TaxID=1922219 RepID=UPI00131F15BE|nr:pyruvate/2-oxoglutarate dehydrogenase complex [Tateyamaria sp. Alg231-49]